MSLVPGGGVKKESKMQGPVPTVVVKAGACMKGGGEGGSKKPQKRYFLLGTSDDGHFVTLAYYKKKNDKPQGTIMITYNMRVAKVGGEEVGKPSKIFMFVLEMGNRTMPMATKTQEERDEWIIAFRKCVALSEEGHTKQMVKLALAQKSAMGAGGYADKRTLVTAVFEAAIKQFDETSDTIEAELEATSIVMDSIHRQLASTYGDTAPEDPAEEARVLGNMNGYVKLLADTVDKVALLKRELAEMLAPAREVPRPEEWGRDIALEWSDGGSAKADQGVFGKFEVPNRLF